MQAEVNESNMALWNEICYLVDQQKKKGVLESEFQNVVEDIFEKLGWSRSSDELVSKQMVRVGAQNKVYPDILLKDGQKNVIVIELKQPGMQSSINHITQLTSYIRLLNLNYGIFIGDNLELYYDDSADTDIPIKIFSTAFQANDNGGEEFIGIIRKRSFDKQKFQEYCDFRLEQALNEEAAQELVVEYQTKEGVDKLYSMLEAELSKDYNENIVGIVLAGLDIDVKAKANETTSVIVKSQSVQVQDEQISGKMPIEIIPEDVDVFKDKFIENREAKMYYHYKDGTIEEKIWKLNNFTKDSNLMGNLRSRPYARKGAWKEKGIVKLVCKVGN